MIAEEETETAHSQLPFEESDSFDRHLDTEESDEMDDVPFEDDRSPQPPPSGSEPPRARRTWILGAALPLVALLLVFVFSGRDSPPPAHRQPRANERWVPVAISSRISCWKRCESWRSHILPYGILAIVDRHG